MVAYTTVADFDWQLLLNPPILCILVGSIFLLLGVIGGGITFKQIHIPSIALLARLTGGLAGIFLIAIGIYFLVSQRQTESSGVTLLDCSHENDRDLKSVDPLGTEEPATISLKNDTSQTLDVYWIDQNGADHLYFPIGGHQDVPASTYVGHVWLLRRKADQKCLAIFQVVVPRVTIQDSRISNH
jgi:hypothetical protein